VSRLIDRKLLIASLNAQVPARDYLASFVKSDRLLGATQLRLPGAGLLRRGHRLTRPDAQLSQWSVPSWLDPTQGGVGMTYHPPHRWEGNGRVTAASRGQEFVAHIADRTDALQWIVNLLQGAGP
jgi:hypothetical protein